MKILFLTLRTFSATGGIEKVCRVAGKAMHEYCNGLQEGFAMFSMYDEKKIKTGPYLPSKIFKGFGGRRLLFIIKSFQFGIKSRVVVLSHINLLLPGYFIKLISPASKIVLIAHGIEVWKPLSSRKKKILARMDLIIPVSVFTKEKMKLLFNLPEQKFLVLNNCLDPFLPEPSDEFRRHECRTSYSIAENDIVLMTLSRLSSNEKRKGYDKVLIAIKKLQVQFPQLKYLFVGKYDIEEKKRLDGIIHDLGIEDDVIFTGFVPDAVLSDFYNMADVYIMPSEKEGFGISFIEALYYSKPVIAGNRDGTSDALYGGRLGTLVDPRSQEEITNAIQKVISDVKAFIPDRKLIMEKFGYNVYKKNLGNILETLKD